LNNSPVFFPHLSVGRAVDQAKPLLVSHLESDEGSSDSKKTRVAFTCLYSISRVHAYAASAPSARAR
jgi:hypothetical protein